jgi:phage gp36-like protein
VPLAPVPGLIQRLACDVARFLLHDERPTDAVKEAYQAALKMQREVSTGVVKLQSAGVEAASQAGGVSMAGPGRVFSTDSLKDY